MKITLLLSYCVQFSNLRQAVHNVAISFAEGVNQRLSRESKSLMNKNFLYDYRLCSVP